MPAYHQRKFLPVLLSLVILLGFTPFSAVPAQAVTYGTGNGTYDFGGLGTAGSAGAAFTSLGDKFKVPDNMYTASPALGAATGDNTALYLTAAATATAVFHAAGNGTCGSFTFRDMGVSAYQDMNSFATFRLVLKDNLGTVLADENLGPSAGGSIPTTSIVQLSTLYPAHGIWNVPGVSTIEITYTLAVNQLIFLTFENITVANVSDKYLNTLTPVILAQPSDKSVNVGQPASLSVSASPVTLGTLSYQWYSSATDTNAGGALISGAVGSTYAAPTGALGTIYYYCAVTNTDANAINSVKTTPSRAAKVAVNELVNAQPPVITAQPQNTTVKTNISGSVSVTATASGTLSYQWYSNAANSNVGGNTISGANSSTYSVTRSTVGTTYYYCIVTNTDTGVSGTQTASTRSEAASITVTYGAGTYDFSGLGTAGSAGTGYARLGNLFKVPDGMFLAAPSLNSTVGGPLTAVYSSLINAAAPITVRFLAEGGINCSTFTFRDMGLSMFSAADNFTSFRLVARNELGDVIADELLGTSAPVPVDSIIQLSTLYSRGPWNITDAASIEITYALASNFNDYLTFENITLNDVTARVITAITAAGVSGIVPPAAGAAPTAYSSLVPGHAGYTVTGLAWQNPDGSPATLTGGRFKADSIYKASVELTAASGYKFPAGGLLPAVNAGTAGPGITSGGDTEGNRLTFSVLFTPTAPLAVTGITVSAQPLLTYVEGQALDLANLRITITYNDTSSDINAAPAQFADKGITTDPAHGVILAAGSNGQTVTVSCGGQTAQTGTLTISAATYTISALPKALEFGSMVEGYIPPASQKVTITNTGNSPITLTLPSSAKYTLVPLGLPLLAPGANMEFTMQPLPGLAAGDQGEVLTVSTDRGITVDISAAFTVQSATYTISASPSVLDFGSTIDGYVILPVPQPVNVTNTGNTQVLLTLPASVQYSLVPMGPPLLDPGASVSVLVQPLPGLAAGSHGELLTIGTDRGTTADISAAFTVQAATYTISTAPATLDFGSTTEGYAIPPLSQTVTVTNTGNSPLVMIPPTSTRYLVMPRGAPFLDPGGSTAYSVQPLPGLAAGDQSETITFLTDRGGNTAGISVSFTVQAADYAISVDPASLDFGSAIEGYGAAPAAQTVTVTNNGNSTVLLSLTGSTMYLETAVTPPLLAPGESSTFNVQPMPGLPAGLRSEPLRVSTDHGTFADVSATFTVQSAGYTIAPDLAALDFGNAIEGYAASPAAQTVTITNTGNSPVTLTLPTSTSYTLGTLSAAGLAAGESAAFTVQPQLGLSTGDYNDTLTVSTDRGTTAGVAVSFTVQAAAYSISAAPAALDFGSIAEGYAAAPAFQTVTVTNTGNMAVTLTQPAAVSFIIGPLSALNIMPLEAATFTVSPLAGLTQGSHSEAVSISGTGGAAAEVSALFTITEAPVYSIGTSPSLLAFGSLAEGYIVPATQTVTITNTGNQPVTLYQPAAVNFTTGTLSSTELIPGAAATFTASPNAGLAAGVWDETIQILGSNGVSAAVDASFTCTAPFQYPILSGSGSVYQLGTPGPTYIQITSSGVFGNFTGLMLNGQWVDAGNYNVTEGSTIVTLLQSYLETLLPGTFTLRLNFADGYSEAQFVIQNRIPDTGDKNTLAVYGVMAALSTAALLFLRKKAGRRIK